MTRSANRILVIEDDPDIRLFLAASLGGAGYEVVGAARGREGIDSAEEETPALVILDLGLPDMNGIDVVRRLRANGDVPIIILSARTDEREKIRALDAGADDYLTKPFGVGELLARVRAAADRLGGSAPRALDVRVLGTPPTRGRAPPCGNRQLLKIGRLCSAPARRAPL